MENTVSMNFFRSRGATYVVLCLLLVSLCFTLPAESNQDGLNGVNGPATKEEPLKLQKRDGSSGEDSSFFNRVKDKIKNALKANEKAEPAPAALTTTALSTASAIIVSEVGDNTFFMACLLAMRHPAGKLALFAGSLAAEMAVTLASVGLGWLTGCCVPAWAVACCSGVAFAGFGAKMLHEASRMSPDKAAQEYREAEDDLRRRQRGSPSASSSALAEAFLLTFLAEWGDRSQVAAVLLAARDTAAGVILGGALGHAACTGLAVVCGQYVARTVSVRTVTLVGGVVFLLCAVSSVPLALLLLMPPADGE